MRRLFFQPNIQNILKIRWYCTSSVNSSVVRHGQIFSVDLSLPFYRFTGLPNTGLPLPRPAPLLSVSLMTADHAVSSSHPATLARSRSRLSLSLHWHSRGRRSVLFGGFSFSFSARTCSHLRIYWQAKNGKKFRSFLIFLPVVVTKEWK